MTVFYFSANEYSIPQKNISGNFVIIFRKSNSIVSAVFYFSVSA